jgi:hypothetical protein
MNSLLADELTAINQYMVHSEMCTNWGYSKLNMAMFCHHLKDDELLRLFIYFRQHVKLGFIINDLHRHWLAYYSAWLFTRLLNGTKLAKNDGPVSVLRGFKSGEHTCLLTKANIRNYSIQKEWAFRYLIISKT